MGKVIGKVIATEKNPSTIDDFYFWTKQDLILKVIEIQGENAKRMNICDFLRGNQINEFEIFE